MGVLWFFERAESFLGSQFEDYEFSIEGCDEKEVKEKLLRKRRASKLSNA